MRRCDVRALPLSGYPFSNGPYGLLGKHVALCRQTLLDALDKARVDPPARGALVTNKLAKGAEPSLPRDLEHVALVYGWIAFPAKATAQSR